MRIGNLTAALLTTCLAAASIPVTSAQAQSATLPNSSTSVTASQTTAPKSHESSVVQRELDLEGRLKKDLDSGVLPRASFDRATVELNNIRVQDTELTTRDGALNATDRDFIMARITDLERRLFAPQTMTETPVAVVAQVAPAMAGLSETPGALTCNGKRVLLSIGRDHATASVQRYGSANIALIVEAVGSPYDRDDSITLRVTGAGINAKVDGARAGQYVMASTTTNFSLKSKQSAKIVANVLPHGNATPQYVKIWGSCLEYDSDGS